MMSIKKRWKVKFLEGAIQKDVTEGVKNWNQNSQNKVKGVLGRVTISILRVNTFWATKTSGDSKVAGVAGRNDLR